MLYGQTQCLPPSRFLKEIDPGHLYKIGGAREVRSDISASAVTSEARAKGTKAISSALKSSFARKPAKQDGLSWNEIAVGMSVVHQRFGEGIVLKVEPVAGDALVTVDFDGMKKNMLANTAGLKRSV